MDPYRVVIERRIAQLLSDRRWYRKQPSPGYWFDLAQEARRELLILLRLRREARDLAAEEQADYLRSVAALFPEQADPITASKSYHDWQATGPR